MVGRKESSTSSAASKPKAKSSDWDILKEWRFWLYAILGWILVGQLIPGDTWILFLCRFALCCLVTGVAEWLVRPVNRP